MNLIALIEKISSADDVIVYDERGSDSPLSDDEIEEIVQALAARLPRRERGHVTNANRYPANVFWSDEDGGFIALALDLPGCSAFGDTQSEALAQLQEATEAWVEAAQSAGNPIPKPSAPAKEAEYSTRAAKTK